MTFARRRFAAIAALAAGSFSLAAGAAGAAPAPPDPTLILPSVWMSEAAAARRRCR